MSYFRFPSKAFRSIHGFKTRVEIGNGNVFFSRRLIRTALRVNRFSSVRAQAYFFHSISYAYFPYVDVIRKKHHIVA